MARNPGTTAAAANTVAATAPVAPAAVAAAPAPATSTPAFELEMAPEPEANTRVAGSKYPWHSMEIGHRFFIAGKVAKNVGGICTSARSVTGHTFVAYQNSEKIHNPKKDANGAIVDGVWIQRVTDRPVRSRKPKDAAPASAAAPTAETPAVAPAPLPLPAAPAPEAAAPLPPLASLPPIA